MASLSPTTLVIFILLLGTTRAGVNAAAFLIGWAVSLTIVFAGSYALGTSHTTQRGSGRTALEVAEILFGMLLLGLGARAWRRRNLHVEGSAGWASGRLTRHLNDLGPGGAAVVGVLKQPWAITAAAAIVVVHHHPVLLVTLIAFACFTVVSTATIGLMFVYYSRRPGDAEAYLAVLRDRVVASGPAMLAIVAALAGGVLTIDGVIGLSGA
jgi:hypothetical protein